MTDFAISNYLESMPMHFRLLAYPPIVEKNLNIDSSDKVVREVRRAKKEAPKIIQQILHDLATGKTEPQISFEEPDQTPLKNGYESMLLRQKWTSAMDLPNSQYNPVGCGYLSSWFWTIFLGNLDEFLDIVDKMSDKEVKKMLGRREGYLQLSAIFLPVLGAKVLYSLADEQISYMRSQHGKMDRKHMQILKKIIELGAKVDDRDLAGYTPLHHCMVWPGGYDLVNMRVSSSDNEMVHFMAQLLLQHGADPNAVNRFGTPPLMACVVFYNLPQIELLIKHKADPYLKDNDGCSPLDVGKFFPAIKQRMGVAYEDSVEQEREAARTRGDLKVCAKCGKKAEKRCTGCFFVWYCGRDCQQQHWTEHAKECKKTRKEYEEVVLSSHPRGEYISTINWKDGVVDMHKGIKVKPKVSQFVVKVQVPMDPGNGLLLVYNKDRDVKYMISSCTRLGSKLITTILSNDNRGMFKLKGYFYSIFRDGKHFINPRLLPPEKW